MNIVLYPPLQSPWSSVTQGPFIRSHSNNPLLLPSAGASPTPPPPTISFTTWALWTPLRPPLFLSCIVWDPGTPSHPTPLQSPPRTPSSASFPSPACSGPLGPCLDPPPSLPLCSEPLGRSPGTSSPF